MTAPVAGTHPSFKTLRVSVAPEAAFDALVAAVAREKFETEIVSKSGGVIRTGWALPDGAAAEHPALSFELRLTPGVCTVRASTKDARTTLDDAEFATMNRLLGDLQASLASAAGEGYAPAGAPTPTPAPGTPFAAAQAAIGKAGLHVERALEAAGRLETSWNDSEAASVTISDEQIHYRVRYVVTVSGRAASARAEIEKSNDERSWLPRGKTTKKEDATLEKLRHALREAMEVLPK